MYRIIYPEARPITDAEIISWAYDVKVNNAVDEHVAQHGLFDDDSTDYDRFCSSIPKPTLDEAIEILEDSGKATFAAQGRR